METTTEGYSTSFCIVVRFHLGSGINGNCFLLDKGSRAFGLVRFHLGSGINGNLSSKGTE